MERGGKASVTVLRRSTARDGHLIFDADKTKTSGLAAPRMASVRAPRL